MKNILYMAISLDGKTTRMDDDTSWVEDSDIARMDVLMMDCGVMVMGSNTYRSFGDELPNDKALLVVFTKNADLLRMDISNVRFTSEDPKKVLDLLSSEGFEKIMIAGGSELNTYLLNNGLIDEIRLIMKPIVIGNGKSLFNELPNIVSFDLISSTQLAEGAVELVYRKH